MKTILVDAVETFVVEKNSLFQVSQEMYDLLETFPNQKIIVTNANDEEFGSYGLHGLPYETFTLKHNPDKTSPKYFEHLLQHFNLSPTDVVYFEHNPDAVKSAQSVGIPSYHYDSEKKDLEALKMFLDNHL